MEELVKWEHGGELLASFRQIGDTFDFFQEPGFVGKKIVDKEGNHPFLVKECIINDNGPWEYYGVPTTLTEHEQENISAIIKHKNETRI